MTIRKYLKDRWLLFIGWFVFVGLTVLIMWLTPGFELAVSTVIYLVLLEALLLVLFLGIDYSRRRYFWQSLNLNEGPASLQNYLEVATSEEELFLQEYMNSLLAEHQQVLQGAINSQQDQKDYIDSWIHEIKVPLAAVTLLLQSVEDDIPEQKYYQLENELTKIDEYVEQVLYYARLDSFSRDYLIQEYSIKGILQEVVKQQRNYFIQNSLQYAFEGNDELVLTDAKWVAFILQQIFSNAVKYTPPGGKIAVKVSRDQKGVHLAITDTGIGIPPADLRRIFDKGFTGENDRRAQQHSTGLGLYLADKLSEKLGHKLTVNSEVGKGTMVTLTFPTLTYYDQ